MKWVQVYKYYLIYTLTLIAMLALVSGVFIYPAFHKIILIKQEISQEKTDLESKLNLGLNAKKTKEELDSIESSLQNLDTVLLKQGNELNLLSDLENLGTKHKINLVIKPDFNGQSIGSNINKIPLEIKAIGQFNSLMAFTNDLDTTPYYFISDNLSLRQVDKDLELILTGQVYINSDAKTKK